MKTDRTNWQALFLQALAGNTEAFGQVWQGYLYPQLYPSAIKLLGNREDADDLMQSIFVQLFDEARYQHLIRQDVESFLGYARKMVRHAATDLLRHAKQTQFVITPETLAQLQSAGVSATIQAQLAALQHRPPVSQETFLNAVRDVLGAACTAQMQALILRASRIGQRRSHELTPAVLERHADAETTLPTLEHAEIAHIFAEEIRPTLTATEWLVFSHKHTDEEFSYHKLAVQTGIPRSTLHEHYQRARTKVLQHPRLQTYWEAARVTACDLRDLETARELRYRHGQPHQAQFVLTLLLKKFRAHSDAPTVRHFKAQVLALLGGLAIVQNSVEQGLVYYQRAYYLWKGLHDAEQQVAALLDIAVNYANLQFAGPRHIGRQRAWRYFQDVQTLLTPTMPAYDALHGKYTRRLGYFYENVQDYAAAEAAVRQSLHSFEQTGVEVEVYVSRRELGVILLRQGQCEAAAPLLESVAAAPTLQSPIDRAKIFGLLSDLAFAMRQPDQGWRYFQEARTLCAEYGLAIQHRALRSLLSRHRLSER